jgi:hypothetical protein
LIGIAETGVLEHAKEMVIGFSTDPIGQSPKLLTELLRTARQLKVLKLYKATNPLLEKTVIGLPKLEILHLTDLNDFWSIHAPKLQSLTVSWPRSSQMKPDRRWIGKNLTNLITDLESLKELRLRDTGNVPFPGLASITWNSLAPETGVQTSFLPAITHVSFNSRADTYEKAVATIDYFCLTLIQYPDACPALESINSTVYPFWDLLFAVILRRRNNTHLRNIKSIGLPGYPFVTILRMLVEALGRSSGEPIVMIDSILQRRVELW